MQERQVLLLNASEEILKVIDWQRAIALMMAGKATSPMVNIEEYDIRSVSKTYKLPKVLILSKYINIPYKENLPSRRNIFMRDRWRCQYCGKTTRDNAKMTIDHVIPRSRGGDSSWTNLVAACSRCNSRKANNTPKECGMKLKKKPQKPSNFQLHISRISKSIIESWHPWLKKTG